MTNNSHNNIHNNNVQSAHGLPKHPVLSPDCLINARQQRFEIRSAAAEGQELPKTPRTRWITEHSERSFRCYNPNKWRGFLSCLLFFIIADVKSDDSANLLQKPDTADSGSSSLFLGQGTRGMSRAQTEPSTDKPRTTPQTWRRHGRDAKRQKQHL